MLDRIQPGFQFVVLFLHIQQVGLVAGHLIEGDGKAHLRLAGFLGPGVTLIREGGEAALIGRLRLHGMPCPAGADPVLNQQRA